ncbi:MAG TPA: hypothetical protein VMF13_14695 [Luteitalea sp.]|nr:hypothetical protein [Luteitalea sp.]
MSPPLGGPRAGSRIIQKRTPKQSEAYSDPVSPPTRSLPDAFLF